ncbi:uncharacterized protein LOC131169315 [Hevea brasiliensis]|uniref:uncharacterized protein LOC131169315 n=1 Tax=Hevea brasiliensis TaxID=3981 RepID=UPI0025F8314B|nr:uncharacterized protein LOC131169315 [Hevea brasiliensis]
MDTRTSSAALRYKNDNNRKDPAWKYVHLFKPPNTNDLVSNFCNKVTKGEIYRPKQHLAGGHRNVPICKRCPAHVREEIQDYMLKKVAAMDFDKTSFPDFEDVKRMNDDEDENEISANIEVSQQGSSKVANMRKKSRTKGPIDVFFAQNAERAEKDRKNAKLK